MAGRYKGAVGGRTLPQYRREGPASDRMNDLIDLLNIGVEDESVISRVYEEMGDLYSQVVDEQVQPEQEYLSRTDPDIVEWYRGKPDNVTEDEWAAQVGPRPTPSEETYVPDYNVDTTYNIGDVRYTGPGLQARIAGRVGEDQVNFPHEVFSQVFPNMPSTDPRQPLSLDAEGYYLEEFAKLKGVSTLDIERRLNH